MIKTEIRVPLKYDIDMIKDALCAHLPIEKQEIKEIKIFKKTLKIEETISYSLSVGVSFSEDREAGLLKIKKKVSEAPSYDFSVEMRNFSYSPIVVGAGPAGLFAALVLAEGGAYPIILERGDSVDRRAEAVNKFFSEKILDAESNIQFGEGGAGAFSDGKLKVGSMDKYKYKVLSEFVNAGAPEDIIYIVGAHLGTDKLPEYVKNIREKIKSLGGKFLYRSRLSDILIKSGKITGVKYECEGREHTIETDKVILATGHSAKDTFEMLYNHGIPMESRGFGIGMRIEHPREYINSLIYKNDKSIANDAGTASYHLVTHLTSGRSVYSFCMCPGGTVVAAASEEGGIVTNGMSEYLRDADNSNAAHLVSLMPSDFGSDHPLAGIYLQRKIEKAAFLAAGADFTAPSIRMDDFLKGREVSPLSPFVDVKPSYPCGTKSISPNEYLPGFITDSLREGIADFDKWLPGFNYSGALLTGPETRSTSPVKIFRNEDFMSPAVIGLYPIGEGAGYAGGIVSSAVDGVKAAEKIIEM